MFIVVCMNVCLYVHPHTHTCIYILQRVIDLNHTFFLCFSLYKTFNNVSSLTQLCQRASRIVTFYPATTKFAEDLISIEKPFTRFVYRRPLLTLTI